MKPLFPYKYLILILIITLSISCKKNETPASSENNTPIKTDVGTPIGNPSAAVIGKSGGTLNSTDGNISVVIPTDALSESKTISIQPITNTAPLGMGLTYELLPEGTTFSKPVTLTFHYTQELLGDSIDDFLWIVTQANDGSWNAMLKSVVDKVNKTVTIQTTHFSRWTLGKFIDLSLSPSSVLLKKGQSVKLKVNGFVREKSVSDNDDLAPLIPITSDADDLTPLTPINPLESRLMDFRIKQWTLNGVAAPVSNENGKLSVTQNSATYTAPNKKPTTNPVAVTVQIETNNKAGKMAKFLLTSSIHIIEEDFYLSLKIDGVSYDYFQYGFNGAIYDDPNNFSTVSCRIEDVGLTVTAAYIENGKQKYSFMYKISKPGVGSHTLTTIKDGGTEYMDFTNGSGASYVLPYVSRKINPQTNTCEQNDYVGLVNVTLLKYNAIKPTMLNPANFELSGSISGNLYESPGFSECKEATAHSITGEFSLVLVK